MENGARFEFGENWSRFLARVDDLRIAEAEKSLQNLLGLTSLSGQTFLDIGSGSGLFSLAAHRLGATVRSFDYDPQSVTCTHQLKERYAPKAENWTIGQGSVLDTAFLNSLGSFDIVYSWGVLHHTGAMWSAIEQAARLVKPQGRLAIALYNDQGLRSKGWLFAKKIYNRLPTPVRSVYASLFLPALWGPTTIKDLVKGRPFYTWKTYASRRGMSPWRDVVDWVGGLPFEVASPGAVIPFLGARGLDVEKVIRAKGSGCNEFLFRRIKT
jgi:2-polyprenyl-3-methyl-5-hydroxy-6-metoxy-1,4-benzoquinol methylase